MADSSLDGRTVSFRTRFERRFDPSLCYGHVRAPAPPDSGVDGRRSADLDLDGGVDRMTDPRIAVLSVALRPYVSSLDQWEGMVVEALAAIDAIAQKEVTEAVVDAQGDLQTGLGVLRLELSQIQNRLGLQANNLTFAEDRLTESLARLHSLLDRLGNPMYQPATHPRVIG